MRILFCGRFDPQYNRTKVIIEGLKMTGAEVDIYNYPKKRKADKKILREKLNSADLVFLPSFTHQDVPFIRKLTSRPILFDPLISRYLSKVHDYKSISRYSPRAYKNFLKDKCSLEKADLVISDTYSHKLYYVDKYKIPPEKIRVVPIGVIRKDFFPVNINRKLNQKLTVGFYGSFIPLHGIDIILQAAGILKDETDIRFKIIGQGVLYDEMTALAKSLELKNVEFSGWKDYGELNEEINKFDIALGIFGSSLKARMVIPNKIFHYAACRKAVITLRSEAINEIFADQKNIFLCENNPEELANAILRLKDNKLREEIAGNSHHLVVNEYNEEKIASIIQGFIRDQL